MAVKQRICKKIIHPYLPAQINSIEKWLSRQTECGWELVAFNGWSFQFINCKPHSSKYFMYSGFGNSSGWSYSYLRAKDKYKKRGAKINKSANEVFEVDLNRIDESFGDCKKSRNRFYRNHYIKLVLFSFTFLSVFGVVCCYDPKAFVVLLAWLASTLYAVISLCIISSQSSQ